MKKILIILLLVLLAFTSCANTENNLSEEETQTVNQELSINESSTVEVTSTTETTSSTSDEESLSVSNLFTDRDLENTYQEEEAIEIQLESNNKVSITEEGVYIVNGQVSESAIIVEVDDESNVQIVLNGVEITNKDMATINVISANKVFVTTVNDNHLEVTGNFIDDNAVVHSSSDLVVNGLGTLTIISTEGNGISSKDDLKITGGTIIIESEKDGLEANDSIRIYDGDLTITTNKDALHCENDESERGYIYIYGGKLTISAADDAIRASSIVQVDGGEINIETCSEGIEGTNILINDGVIDIYSTDDGINATDKSSLEVAIKVTGGQITINMASGDTDGFDSNGNLYIIGGTITVNAVSAFDADGEVVFTGGEVTVNDEQITEIIMTQQGRPGDKKN